MGVPTQTVKVVTRNGKKNIQVEIVVTKQTKDGVLCQSGFYAIEVFKKDLFTFIIYCFSTCIIKLLGAAHLFQYSIITVIVFSISSMEVGFTKKP